MEKDSVKPHDSLDNTEAERHKRKHTLLWISLAIVAIVLVVPVFVAGWFGLVPGLSGLMGANKPKDLGVSYTEADYASYLQKTGVAFKDFAEAPVNPEKPSKKVVFADPKAVTDMQLTQEEITAAINESGWAWMPLSNAQVRFADGTAEISGNLNSDHIVQFVNFIGGVGYEQAEVDRAASWAKTFVNNAAVYAKAAVAIRDGALELQVTQVQIGRFTAPADISNKVIKTGTQNATSRAANFSAKEVAMLPGALEFTGTYPTTIYVRHQ